MTQRKKKVHIPKIVFALILIIFLNLFLPKGVDSYCGLRYNIGFDSGVLHKVVLGNWLWGMVFRYLLSIYSTQFT